MIFLRSMIDFVPSRLHPIIWQINSAKQEVIFVTSGIIVCGGITTAAVVKALDENERVKRNQDVQQYISFIVNERPLKKTAITYSLMRIHINESIPLYTKQCDDLKYITDLCKKWKKIDPEVQQSILRLKPTYFSDLQRRYLHLYFLLVFHDNVDEINHMWRRRYSEKLDHPEDIIDQKLFPWDTYVRSYQLGINWDQRLVDVSPNAVLRCLLAKTEKYNSHPDIRIQWLFLRHRIALYHLIIRPTIMKWTGVHIEDYHAMCLLKELEAVKNKKDVRMAKNLIAETRSALIFAETVVSDKLEGGLLGSVNHKHLRNEIILYENEKEILCLDECQKALLLCSIGYGILTVLKGHDCKTEMPIFGTGTAEREHAKNLAEKMISTGFNMNEDIEPTRDTMIAKLLINGFAVAAGMPICAERLSHERDVCERKFNRFVFDFRKEVYYYAEKAARGEQKFHLKNTLRWSDVCGAEDIYNLIVSLD